MQRGERKKEANNATQMQKEKKRSEAQENVTQSCGNRMKLRNKERTIAAKQQTTTRNKTSKTRWYASL